MKTIGARRRGILTPLAPSLTLLALSLSPGIPLFAGVIRVPQDFATIRAAVAASRDGDSIEVADGIYVEENVVLDKNIRLAAERTHGAVIYSIGEKKVPVFIVRAQVEIQGFVIKNCYEGIVQRHSPDVEWRGRDLIFQNVTGSAICINDASANVGRADLQNIIVEASELGFSTNDAHGIRLRNALIAGCDTAFSGMDHIYFDVDRVVLSKVRTPLFEETVPLLPPSTNRIRLGPDVLDLDSLLSGKAGSVLPPAIAHDLFFAAREGNGKNGAGFQAGEGILLNLIGRACLERGSYAQARDYFRRALESGGHSLFDEIIMAAVYGLARSSQKLGQDRQALDYYDRAIALVDDLCNGLPLRLYREGFLRDKLDIFEDAISFLDELHEKDPASGYGRRAFGLAEKLKSLAFFNSLVEYRFDLDQGRGPLPHPALASRAREASLEISALHLRLQRESLTAAEREASLEELESAENAYKNLTVQPGNRFLRPAGFAGAWDGFLKEGEAVLEYLVGKKQVLGFLLTHDSLDLAVLGEKAEIRELTQDYLKFLSLRSEGDFEAVKGGSRLGSILLGPFEKRLSRGLEKLIIVPGGFLYSLPFEALIWDGGVAAAASAGGRTGSSAMFLAESFDIFYSPSLQSLLSLKNRRRTGSRDMDLLAVMDSRPKSFRSPATSRLFRFPALDSVGTEVESILRLFPAEKTLLLKDKRVSEESFKDLPLERFKIIHVATHGYYDDYDWERSGLLLERRKNSAEDGVLRPIDLYELRLNSDLVVLSGCQTAKGRTAEGMGLLGLSMSFLAAGTRSILASLWNLDDRSTALFMRSFYGHLSEGKTLAAALRSAKIDMIRSKFRHPFFWAAFVLIGDGQAGL